MNNDIITKMIEADCIEHGHFELANVHTDNLVRQDFIYNFEIADIINTKLYQAVKDLSFDTIVTYDNTGVIISYPITLMVKKPMKRNHVKNNFGDVLIIASIITSLEDFNSLLITENVKHIICVTNYSGVKHINGIDVIELVPVNTWSANECPYCKDLENE